MQNFCMDQPLGGFLWTWKVLESMVPNSVARLNLKLVEPVIQTNFWSFLDHFLPIRFYKATYFKNCENVTN